MIAPTSLMLRSFLRSAARPSQCVLLTAAPILEALGHSVMASSADGHSCAHMLRRSALSALCCCWRSGHSCARSQLGRSPLPLRSSKRFAAWSRPVRCSVASALGRRSLRHSTALAQHSQCSLCSFMHAVIHTFTHSPPSLNHSFVHSLMTHSCRIHVVLIR